MNEDGEVDGFRKADGSMASKDELDEDAKRYSANFAADTRASAMYSTIPTNASPHASKTLSTRSLLRRTLPNSEQRAGFVSGDWWRLQDGYGGAWAKRW